MSGLHSANQPDVGMIFAELRAIERTMALKGALDLELFTHIDDGAVTPDAIARRIDASERGVRILCDFLTVCGHLEKRDGAYGLTVNSKMFLTKRSAAYLGSMADFLADLDTLSLMRDLSGVVRTGGSHKAHGLDPEHPMWVSFARNMAPLARMIAGFAVPHLVSGPEPMRVLDIAAGHGMYGITLAQRNPLAEVTGQDWNNVLAVARENADQAGLVDRYRTLPGSAFEVNFGTGYDLVLEPNFAHHFDPQTNATMFRKIHAALRPGGRLALIEFIPNADRVSPPAAASFSMTMLTSTPAGDAYTFDEYKQMLQDTGFGDIRMVDVAPTPQRMVIATA